MRLSSIIHRFENELLHDYHHQILPSHLRALAVMKRCRSHLGPQMLTACSQCDHHKVVPHSCGHRNCPHCQHHESQQWLQRQLKKQVPANYFLLTFTLPAELRALAWYHQRLLYSMMIQCCWATLRTFSENDPQLKGTPGAISVLHTHSRRLGFHPHVHLVIPAAAIDTSNKLWRTKTGYLFNHKALAKVFRAKMLEAITSAELTLPPRYPEKWVVDCKCVGTGAKAIIYLGRYLYRGVIQEKDILACENGNVTFRYRDSKTKQTKKQTVSGARFLWLILQHVLPKGFRRARNFGFLHPNCKQMIALLQRLFRIDPSRALKWMKTRPQWLCPCCGGTMKVIKTRIKPVHIVTPLRT